MPNKLHPVERAIREHIPIKSKIVVAVSGGLDSVVLFNAITKLSEKLKINLIVAHFDHGLRKESKKDLLWIKKIVEKNKIKFISNNIPPKPPKNNIEAWAREKRYTFLEGVRKKNRAQWVITAHHADDVAETLLLKLFANRSLKTIYKKDTNRKLLRPFLHITRAQIEEYAKLNKLKFRHDSTNSCLDFRRNWVRLKLIPLLRKEYGGSIVKVLTTAASGIDDDLCFIEKMLEIKSKGKIKGKTLSKEWTRSSIMLLKKLEPPLRWRYLDRELFPHLGYSIGRTLGGRLVDFFLGNSPQIEIPGNMILQRKNGEIRLGVQESR